MRRSVGIVLFPEVAELSFVGPWQVFTALRRLKPDACAVFTVSETGGAVRCGGGLRVLADHRFASAPRADVLLVPGGPVEVAGAALLAYIRQAGAQADLVVSVSAGALLLEQAGFLAGKRATTDRASLDLLRAPGSVEVLQDARWVDAGAVLTAAGGTAGLDLALGLVRRLWGPAVAQQVQDSIDYAPHPLGVDTRQPGHHA
jgi:transcriptional regulator GlxA family with amidase domain